jgi:predicted ATPase/class 3 adenylate cyclase
MAQIPSGTVTLLFTDIEGSTRIWEAQPETMARALRRHDEILRSAIADTGGFVFKTVGDAFCASFATPRAALDAALAAQQHLAAEDWPTARPIRVRMGLHTGVCEERDRDYFGPVVNRAARLGAIAHGGQVVMSGATAELLRDNLSDGLRLRDLGLHRLKDLGRPEQVFQLEAGFLQASFPHLASLDNPEFPNNLPGLLSTFVGRRRELEEVRSLLASSRLVTLTGTGGCGKTRLALQAAAEFLESGKDGVWLVELAALSDAGQIPAAVAEAIGLHELGQNALIGSLMETLREQDTLILLDNCEHVVDAAARFCSQIAHSCPGVRVIATSREPLGVEGERVYRVASLSLPPGDPEDPADLAASDAIQLFSERARAQDSSFALDETVGPMAASICRRLDGIPLALELAAARLSSMSLAHLHDRLDQRFRLLTGGNRNVMPRQQTLQATVDWSFSLLSEPEREMLRRLSVFVGGFELEAAEATCTTEQIDSFQVMDLLGSLVDKSLVVADRSPVAVRYRMLETIRQYGTQELLRTNGEAGVLETRNRHADFYLRLVEAAAPALAGSQQGMWLRRLDLEWENLRAVFDHLEAERRTDDVLRLGTGLERFALSRGHAEVIARLRRAIPEADPEPSTLLAEAFLVSSMLIHILLPKKASERAVAKRCAEQGLAIARALGSPGLEARALGLLAIAAYLDHDLSGVRRHCEAGLALCRQAGDTETRVLLLSELGLVAQSAGERRGLALEALEVSRKSGDVLFGIAALNQLYGLDLHAGLLDDARARLEEAIAAAEDLGAELVLHLCRTNFGVLLLIEGEHEEAAPVVRRALLMARRFGAGVDVSEVIFAAACCAAWQGRHVLAARLHGAADKDISAALADRSIGWSGLEQQLREDEQGRLRDTMGHDAFAAAYGSGAELSRMQAVELALGR